MGDSALIKQSKHCSTAFARGVYADLLRWGDSEALTLICRNSRPAEDETYLDCLRRFYRSMKRHYCCEYVFKNELAFLLREKYASEKNFIIINEFRVGNSIADLACFNGESIAFEIKTSFDSPRRLLRQMNAYKRVFDRCYIVVEEEEVDNWKDYDCDAGVIAFCHGKRGKISLREVRRAKQNMVFDVDLAMGCLRATEYESIAEQFTGKPLASPKHQHYAECLRVLKQMNTEELRAAFRTTIEKRKSSVALLRQTPRELYQVCLSMHLNEQQLSTITNQLNTKVIS